MINRPKRITSQPNLNDPLDDRKDLEEPVGSLNSSSGSASALLPSITTESRPKNGPPQFRSPNPEVNKLLRSLNNGALSKNERKTIKANIDATKKASKIAAKNTKKIRMENASVLGYEAATMAARFIPLAAAMGMSALKLPAVPAIMVGAALAVSCNVLANVLSKQSSRELRDLSSQLNKVASGENFSDVEAATALNNIAEFVNTSEFTRSALESGVFPEGTTESEVREIFTNIFSREDVTNKNEPARNIRIMSSARKLAKLGSLDRATDGTFRAVVDSVSAYPLNEPEQVAAQIFHGMTGATDNLNFSGNITPLTVADLATSLISDLPKKFKHIDAEALDDLISRIPHFLLTISGIQDGIGESNIGLMQELKSKLDELRENIVEMQIEAIKKRYPNINHENPRNNSEKALLNLAYGAEKYPVPKNTIRMTSMRPGISEQGSIINARTREIREFRANLTRGLIDQHQLYKNFVNMYRYFKGS